MGQCAVPDGRGDASWSGMNMRLTLVSLAFLVAGAANAGDFYTVRESDNVLCKVDVSTGATTAIGALGVAYEFGDLAWDQSTSTMYMTDGWGALFGGPGNIYTVNLSTGAATLVGNSGITDLFGLAIDPTSGKLYGSKSTISFGVASINKATGAGTFLGGGAGNVGLDGMTYVASTGQIVGCFAGPGSFYSVDPSTGAYTNIANPGFFINNCGIAWNPNDNFVYSVDWSGALYKFDVANGYNATLVAGLGSAFDGLAYAGVVPEPATMVALSAGLLALVRRRRK